MSVILKLVGIANFQRRDLKDGAGLPVGIIRNQTIKVSAKVAEQLLSDDYTTNVAENESYVVRAWFEEQPEGTAVTHDFTQPINAVGTASTTHDLTSLPETKPLTAETIAEAAATTATPAAPATVPVAPKPAARPVQRKPAAKSK